MMTRAIDGSKERRKYERGRLIESQVLSDKEIIVLTKTGGIFDKWLILSFFKDPYAALTDQLRKEVAMLVKVKDNEEKVWFNLLALHVYTKFFLSREKVWGPSANNCMIYLRQNAVYKPEVPLRNMKLYFKEFK
jgi:predicted RecB family endonuclease